MGGKGSISSAGGRLELGMSNFLKVSQQEAIRGLHQKEWSKRRIARELSIHRQTVSRYSEQDSKCTGISISGLD